jgi:hypothetical protein
MDRNTQPKVPVGVTSQVGYGVTATALIAAVVAFVSGDRSEQTLGVLTAAALAAVSLGITQIGRYLQARELARNTYHYVGQDVEQAEAAKNVEEDAYDDEPGDVFDGLPDIPTAPAESLPVEKHLGDPRSRGEA